MMCHTSPPMGTSPPRHSITRSSSTPSSPGEFREPLQSVAEVLREEFRVRVLCPFVCGHISVSFRWEEICYQINANSSVIHRTQAFVSINQDNYNMA